MKIAVPDHQCLIMNIFNRKHMSRCFENPSQTGQYQNGITSIVMSLDSIVYGFIISRVQCLILKTEWGGLKKTSNYCS